MHRFLGYNWENLTHEYVLFTIDFILLVFLLIIWRPLVLILIYTELVLHMVCELMLSVAVEIWFTVPLILISIAIYQNTNVTLLVGVTLLLEKIILFGFSSGEHILCSYYCFRCIWSLSLLLRFFAPFGTKHSLNKHNLLVKTSFCYRFFHHMI